MNKATTTPYNRIDLVRNCHIRCVYVVSPNRLLIRRNLPDTRMEQQTICQHEFWLEQFVDNVSIFSNATIANPDSEML